MKYLLDELLKKAIVPSIKAAEEGAPAGAVKDPPPKDEHAPAAEPEYDLPVDGDIPPEEMKKVVEEDPEFKDALVKDKKERKEKEPVEKKDVSDKDAEDDNGKVPGAGKDGKDGKPADEKDSGKEAADEIEFADNVIEGLSGKDFKVIPDAAKEAIAKFHESHTNLEREHGETKSRLESLLNDPVIKNRAEMLAEGQSEYEAEDLSEEERATIVGRLKEKLDLNDKEASDVVALFEDGLNDVVKERTGAERQNYIIQHDRKAKHNEVVAKGKELIRGLSKINPELAVKETDIDKFYAVKDGKTVYNDKHPEIEKFKKGLGAIQAFCGQLGITYDKALEMGPESLYGMVAPKLGLPVAFNNNDRDKRISAEAKSAVLKPFLKSGGDRALSETSTAAAEKKRNTPAGEVEEDGYFLKKLASDPKYYERCCETVPAGVDYEAHLKKIDAYANKGRALLRQEPKK